MSDTVVIAGAGPVGLMLAYELSLAGVEPVVLDQTERQRVEAPGLAINSTVVELLTQRGLMDALRDDGVSFPIAHFAHLWLEPTKLTERHPFTFGVIQAQLERRLAEALAKRGVEVRRGRRVVSVEQWDDEVVVDVETSSGHERIGGRYLVGCDGANSTVRDLTGIDFPGEEYPFYGITGDLEVEPGGDLFQKLGPDFYPAGAFSVVPAGPEGIASMRAMAGGEPLTRPVPMRVLTGEFDVAPPDEKAPPTLAELRACAQRITGEDLTMGEPIWLSRWGYTKRQAARYRRGRVFLAGDAAHVHFPLGGQALSTGIEDAVNLGWKLAADLRGWAPENLLDTYHDERHPVGARALMTTQAQVSLLHPWDKAVPVRELLTELIRFGNVNEYFVTMAAALDVRYPMSSAGHDHPLLGRRLPGVTLRLPAGSAELTDLQHEGRGILLDLTDGVLSTADFTAWADRLDVVTAESTPDLDATVVLLRPDGRVAWADRDPADPAGLRTAVSTWFGTPSSHP